MNIDEFKKKVSTRTESGLASRTFYQLLLSNPTFDDLVDAWSILPDECQERYSYVLSDIVKFFQNDPRILIQLAYNTSHNALKNNPYIIKAIIKQANQNNLPMIINFINDYKDLCIGKYKDDIIQVLKLTRDYHDKIDYSSAMEVVKELDSKKYNYSESQRDEISDLYKDTLDNFMQYGVNRPELSFKIFHEIIMSHQLNHINMDTNYYLANATFYLNNALEQFKNGKVDFNLGFTYFIAKKQLSRIYEAYSRDHDSVNLKEIDKFASSLIRCRNAIASRPEQVANCMSFLRKSDNAEIIDEFGIDRLVKGIVIKQKKGDLLYREFKTPITVDVSQLDYFLRIKQFPENTRFIIKVNNISEISLNELEMLKDRHVVSVAIQVSDGVRQYYSIDSLIECKQTIDEMLKAIIIPGTFDKNREKKIATQVMYILANTLTYDRNSLKREDPIVERINRLERMEMALNVDHSEELEQLYDELHRIANRRIRNIEGGITEGKTICLGYAEILRNTLSVFGIESRTILGSKKGDNGHAWNQVKLDGKWYNMDLTWASRIIRDRQHINPAKVKRLLFASDSVFYQSHNYTIENEEMCQGCNTTLSDRTIIDIFQQPTIGIPFSEFVEEQESNIRYNKKAPKIIERTIKKINIEHKKNVRKSHIGPVRRLIGKTVIAIANRNGKHNYHFIDDER